MSKENKLLITFTTFMLEHGIECEEDIYQNDKVDEDSLELIEDLFNIVKLTNHTRQTNADRIRNMSDEELLDFICSIETYEEGSVKTIENGVSMHTVTEVMDWLQSEAEQEKI